MLSIPDNGIEHEHHAVTLARLMELVISLSKGPIKRSSSVVVPRLPQFEFIDIVKRSLRNMCLCSSHCC